MSLINRTTFDELAFVLKNAEFCITVDGGIMWLANLVNAQVINIHTFNGRIWEPPVDEKQSFNLRKYHYRNCEPCDWHCRFQGTPRNLECLSYTKKEHIIGIISKYYL